MSIARAAALTVVLAAGLSTASAAQPPSIDDLLNLTRVGSPAISPDGSTVAYTLRETNWDDNEYETDQNVPTQLVLFKGFGHPLNKPKANRAAMHQNFEWFDKYLWPQRGGTQ